MSARAAVVGSGLAGFTAYVTLRHGGLGPDEVIVLGPDADPAGAWRPRAAAIRQRTMRSESDGHCFARSFPGLAVHAARRRRSPLPLLRTLANRFNPTVDEFLEHVEELRAASGWDVSHRRAVVERVRPVEGGFELDGLGTYPHVLLALGHPGLAVPDELADDPRAVHAYEAHDYAEEVEVVGAGMAAATEWVNALAAGARVISVRRREPFRRPLNLPRELFSRRGLAAFHRTGPDERVGLLRTLLAPSYPPGRRWDEPLEQAVRQGRFRVSSELDGAPQVICATGFRRGVRGHALLARLVDEAGLATAGDWLVLDADSTVPGLTDATRTFALAGVAGQWAYPGADTLVGAKWAARRFLRRVQACPTR